MFQRMIRKHHRRNLKQRRRCTTCLAEQLENRILLAADELVPFSYARIEQPRVQTEPNPNYSYNATGEDISFQRLARGRYDVRFDGLAAAGEGGGHVQVNSWGSNDICSVESWRRENDDFVSTVHCFNAAGNADDSSFDIAVIHPKSVAAYGPITINEANIAYTWAGSPSTTEYRPNSFYTYNSRGQVNIERVQQGRYVVTFEGLGSAGNLQLGGHAQLSNYGQTTNTCSVIRWGFPNGDLEAHVDCRNRSGTPADTQFTIAVMPANNSFSTVGYVWANNPTAASYTPHTTYAFNPAGGNITARHLAKGRYNVTFNDLQFSGENGGHVMVTAYGTTAAYCTAGDLLTVNGNDISADINCWDANGVAVDSQFTAIVVPEPEGDRFEPNDRLDIATDLGSGDQVVEDLSILSCGGATEFCSVPDYYKWHANQDGRLRVAISFVHRDGDLDLEVLDQSGAVLASSTSRTDNESLELPIQGGKDYFIRVTGPNGWTNHYDLTIDETAVAPLQNDFFNFRFSPPSPNVLYAGDIIDVTFDFQTNEQDGVYIWAIPVTTSRPSEPGNVFFQPSTLVTGSTGTVERFIGVLEEDMRITSIRFLMANSDNENIYEETIDVDFYYQRTSTIAGDITHDEKLDEADIDAFCRILNEGSLDRSVDFDGNRSIDDKDFEFLIKDVFRTSVGDANLDRRFDSQDLIKIFSQNQYEDGIPNNSTWATGDWNCDGDFDSGDLVDAFKGGAYEVIHSRNRVDLRPHFLIPRRVAGDADFFGHGPRVTMTAELRISPDRTEIQSRVRVRAEETEGGDTVADETSNWETAYVAPHGQIISRIDSPTSSTAVLLTEGLNEASIISGDTLVVRRYEIVGDTSGDDAGTDTGVRFHFHPVNIVTTPLASPSHGVCTIPLRDLSYAPPRVRGDGDFDGNGPLMDSYVQLRLRDGNVQGRVYLHSEEWQSGRPREDFTTFDGWSNWETLFTGNVSRILGPLQSRQSYIDTDHTMDFLPGDSLVDFYRFVGDQDGGILGGDDRPSVAIRFHDIQVQSPNCGGGVVPLRNQFFMPLRASTGDNEFSGHGPTVEVEVEARISDDRTRIETRVYMVATETQSDFSRAEGISLWETAYTAPAGQRIARITSPTRSTMPGFTDTDHDADIVEMPDSDLVDRYEVVGDTNGPDIGVKTGVRVVFNPAHIELEPAPAVTGDLLTFRPRTLYFEPPLARGDGDFAGNGPLTDVYVQLRVADGEVQARVYMHAEEWQSGRPQSDFTTFDGWSNWRSLSFGEIPSGRRVKRIIGPMQSHFSYVDNSHAPAAFDGSDALVAQFVLIGDENQFGGGTDHPSVMIGFREITVELE